MTSDSPYHFAYGPHTVYARVVSLIRQHHTASDGVHLDLGCGFGSIAEPIRELGMTYVGADLASAGMDDLVARGFETHPVDLMDLIALEKALPEMLGGRELGSISVIDTLEHVTNGPEVLEVLARFAASHGNPCLVVSVPNVAHRDLGAKLLLGRWDYTETGLLDRTHVVHHTEGLLGSFTTAAGWREVASADFVMRESDQHFPADSVVLSEATSVGGYLRGISDRANSKSDVNQLVRAYLVGASRGSAWPVQQDIPRPFLSVVMRTQGRRPETMRDALTCLLGQSLQDFELLVMPHRVSPEQQREVARIVEDLPRDLRERSRVIPVENGGRARPLNAGVQAARGRYVAFFDDDDLVLGHWVETFAKLASSRPGRLLRTVAVDQAIEEVEPGHLGGCAHRTVSGVNTRYKSEYDLWGHFTENQSPLMCLAFPTSVFHELGMRFDESLDVLEDWDVQLRTAMLCGVAASREITSIYRRWNVGEASHSMHSPSEWKGTETAVISRLDQVPHVFPPGTIARIRSLESRIPGPGQAVDNERWHAVNAELETLRLDLLTAQRESAALRSSRSWKLTRPVRFGGAIVRKVTGRGGSALD